MEIVRESAQYLWRLARQPIGSVLALYLEPVTKQQARHEMPTRASQARAPHVPAAALAGPVVPTGPRCLVRPAAGL